MRRVVAMFVALECVVLPLYVLVTYDWIDTKQTGLNAFPGSPDWGYIYSQAESSYYWVEGLAVGILLGGIGLAVASRKQVGRLWGIQLAACLALAASVAGGWLVEANAVSSGSDSLVAP